MMGFHTHISHSKSFTESVVLPICLSRSAASSGVALGRTPGSLKLVLSSVPSTNRKSTPPITGMAGVNCCAKYGQLGGQEKMEREREISKQKKATDKRFCLNTDALLGSKNLNVSYPGRFLDKHQLMASGVGVRPNPNCSS